MASVVSAPVEMIESVAALRLPVKTDKRLQTLMDRNNNGLLSADEKEDLEALAELSETLALVRSRAYLLLGRKPS